MAMEAKADFIRQLEASLANSIAAAQLTTVMAAVSDALEGYEMRTAFGNSFAERDDLLDSYISAMKVQGRSTKTIDRYRYEIRRMMQHDKFRRTLATNMARHGMPIQEIASILGHDKIDTTMQYVVLDKDNTESSYRRFTA